MFPRARPRFQLRPRMIGRKGETHRGDRSHRGDRARRNDILILDARAGDGDFLDCGFFACGLLPGLVLRERSTRRQE